jgi:hypothetical protein
MITMIAVFALPSFTDRVVVTTHRLGPVDVTPADFFGPAELGKYFIVSPIDERANLAPGSNYGAKGNETRSGFNLSRGRRRSCRVRAQSALKIAFRRCKSC